ncbi:MAG: ABC transporter permease [Acidobacteriota bacterium]
MLIFLARRLASAALMLFLVFTFTFFLVHLAPGEPALLYSDPRISEAARDAMREIYGWDRPLLEQYARWLGATLSGDWGISVSHSRPVLEVILGRMGPTALLVLTAVAVEHAVGIALGVLAARRAGGVFDRMASSLALTVHSLPSFVLALVAIEWLAVKLPIFPAQHMTSLDFASLPLWAQALDLAHHLALPALVLGLARCGAVVRFVRNGMLEVLGQDYVRTARAKGLSEARVLCLHALPNVCGPLIQRLGLSLPALLSGVLVLEILFSWPGLGTAVYQAILQRDYPVMLASTALTGFMVVAGTLVADAAHGWLDPRVRESVGS